ncbi:hypothetical protein PENTCL1PPCAC_4205, partial [Pristionchus entomophagus]
MEVEPVERGNQWGEDLSHRLAPFNCVEIIADHPFGSGMKTIEEGSGIKVVPSSCHVVHRKDAVVSPKRLHRPRRWFEVGRVHINHGSARASGDTVPANGEQRVDHSEIPAGIGDLLDAISLMSNSSTCSTGNPRSIS